MKCYKGTILSVNGQDEVFHYLVEDQGTIIYVGNDLPEEYRSAELVELGDRALAPSFVDSHQHFASFSTFQAGLNVMEAGSNEEIKWSVSSWPDPRETPSLRSVLHPIPYGKVA